MAAIQPSLNAEKRAQGLQNCLRHRGFGKVTLTPEEAAAFNAAKTDEARRAWLDSFMAGDIAQRVQAALTPPTPDLPSATDADAPFTVGAVRIDPASLALAAGRVSEGGEILTGVLRRRATAILQQDFNTHSGVIGIYAPAGTIFQEYVRTSPEDPEIRDEPTLWCGSFKRGFGMPMCFHNTLHGLQFYMGDGNGQLVGHVRAEPWLVYFKEPMILAVQAVATDPPISFRIIAQSLRKSSVVLIATAGTRNDAVEVWRGGATFDAENKARVGFWDRDLVLTRAGEAVTVAFDVRAPTQ